MVFEDGSEVALLLRVWLWNASKAPSSFVRMGYELKKEKKERKKTKTTLINDEMNEDTTVRAELNKCRERMRDEDESRLKVKERR